MEHLPHRRKGYALLSGAGLEIGALHQPARLPKNCRVSYCDVISVDTARELFPELKKFELVDVTLQRDL